MTTGNTERGVGFCLTEKGFKIADTLNIKGTIDRFIKVRSFDNMTDAEVYYKCKEYFDNKIELTTEIKHVMYNHSLIDMDLQVIKDIYTIYATNTIIGKPLDGWPSKK